MPVTTRSASVEARPTTCAASVEFGLDGLGERRHAAVERVGDRLGPRVDVLVDRVDAADPQVLEAADDLAERTLGFAGQVGDGALGRVGDLVSVRSAVLLASLSACAALTELVCSVLANCSMRISICSVTARVRVSIWLAIVSVRPSQRFS